MCMDIINIESNSCCVIFPLSKVLFNTSPNDVRITCCFFLKIDSVLRQVIITIKRLGCGIKGNCPHVGPGPAGGECPSTGVFLRDPSPYLREFRRKTKKNSERLCDKRDGALMVGWLACCMF